MTITSYIKNLFKETNCISTGDTYTKIGMIQRRLAWPPCRDDTHIREAFQIFYTFLEGEGWYKIKIGELFLDGNKNLLKSEH